MNICYSNECSNKRKGIVGSNHKKIITYLIKHEDINGGKNTRPGKVQRIVKTFHNKYCV